MGAGHPDSGLALAVLVAKHTVLGIEGTRAWGLVLEFVGRGHGTERAGSQLLTVRVPAPRPGTGSPRGELHPWGGAPAAAAQDGGRGTSAPRGRAVQGGGGCLNRSGPFCLVAHATPSAAWVLAPGRVPVCARGGPGRGRSRPGGSAALCLAAPGSAAAPPVLPAVPPAEGAPAVGLTSTPAKCRWASPCPLSVPPPPRPLPCAGGRGHVLPWR